MKSQQSVRPRTLSASIVMAAAIFGLNSSARAVVFDGLQHTALGNATLDTSDARRLPVRNLGSSGQDGVQIDLSSVTVPAGSPFSLDTTIDPLSGVPAGEYLRSTQLGTINGAPNSVISTVQVTANTAGDAIMTTDFSHVWDGVHPLTIEYRHGGPNGVLVTSETFDGPNPSFARSIWPDTWYVDIQWDPYRVSGGFDWNNTGGSALSSARGAILPPTVDFFDVLVPSNVGASYSSVQMTGGGGLNSFTLLSEVVSVPEPSSMALVTLGAVGTGLAAYRRRKNA